MAGMYNQGPVLEDVSDGRCSPPESVPCSALMLGTGWVGFSGFAGVSNVSSRTAASGCEKGEEECSTRSRVRSHPVGALTRLGWLVEFILPDVLIHLCDRERVRGCRPHVASWVVLTNSNGKPPTAVLGEVYHRHYSF